MWWQFAALPWQKAISLTVAPELHSQPGKPLYVPIISPSNSLNISFPRGYFLMKGHHLTRMLTQWQSESFQKCEWRLTWSHGTKSWPRILQWKHSLPAKIHEKDDYGCVFMLDKTNCRSNAVIFVKSRPTDISLFEFVCCWKCVFSLSLDYFW